MAEVQARALFDFVAEGPSELNLTAGEIIIITSGVEGNEWWYARNSSGQSGAVPSSYIEILSADSNTVRTSIDSNLNENNHKIPAEDSYSTTADEQSNPPVEHDVPLDNSFDSLSPSTAAYRNSTDQLNSFDPYTTILDPSTSDTPNLVLGDLIRSSQTVDDSSSTNARPSGGTDSALEQSGSDILGDNTTKQKSEKSKLFTMKRQKTKSDSEKRRGSSDNGLDPRSKDDSDSDCFSDSESSSRTLSTSNKHTLGANDAKTNSRARFFDKHGVGNYLLHEWKTKPDEHVEISINASDGSVCWSANPHIPPFICKIENSSKETKFSGLKSFMEYKIQPQISGSRVVGRRYKQFDWLHEQLMVKYRFICVPPLPGKQIAGRFEHEFVEERRRQLELWLNRICQHPVLCASFPVQHFLTCELTEKNNKDWKAGKRKVEKDELRESFWLHCVTLNDCQLTETEIASQIDRFAKQQPALEIQLKNINQGFSKYLERHTEVYEHDIQRVGELFTKLHLVVQTDSSTTVVEDLTNSMSKISHTYNDIADLYKTKGHESIRDFTERIQDYIGLLSCFPVIINLQRCATEFIRSAQQKGTTAAPDLAGAIHRNQVLNYAVLAEINFFQKEKVNDLTVYTKFLLEEQIGFYEKVISELREALSICH